jgi:hypothetical protein
MLQSRLGTDATDDFTQRLVIFRGNALKKFFLKRSEAVLEKCFQATHSAKPIYPGLGYLRIGRTVKGKFSVS